MPAPSYVAYIDESGDEGFSFHRDSSQWFVLACAVYRRTAELDQLKIIDEVRSAINENWKRINPGKGQRLADRQPLHFRNPKHDERRLWIAKIAQTRVRALAVLIDKTLLTSPEIFRKDNSLYHYAVRLLVERVSWLCGDAPRQRGDQGDGSVLLTFSNRSTLDCEAISDYLRHLETSREALDYRAESSVIRPSQVETYSAGKRLGLQVADAVASGLYFAVTKNRFGMTEPSYAQALSPIIFRHNGNAWGYGAKLLPAEAEEARRRGEILKGLEDWEVSPGP